MHLAPTLKRCVTILLLLSIAFHATISHYFKQEPVSTWLSYEKDDAGKDDRKSDSVYQLHLTNIATSTGVKVIFSLHLSIPFPGPFIDDHTPPPDAPAFA